MVKLLWSFLLFFLGTLSIYAQDRYSQLKIYITAEKSQPKAGVSVVLNQSVFLSDDHGAVLLTLKNGSYFLKISHENYQDKDITVSLTHSKVISVNLQPANNIEEVFIFSKESKGLVTKSVIDRKAMEHLQPSSFSDLMELLPGGLAQTPNLGINNRPMLRENRGDFSSRPGNYDTSSLGTQFMIDGNVINSNADMQVSLDNTQFGYAPATKETASTGVDMRTISTNDIEKVEVIRGIPSASYGDLTSGVIKIERKISPSPLQARFKADGFSKQYYIGKGFRIGDRWQLSAGADFLDSKTTPTDDFENYQRMTASVRSQKKISLWSGTLDWRSNIDFFTNIDSKKNDPDNGAPEIDQYKQTRTRISFANNFIFNAAAGAIFDKITLNTSVRQGTDKTDQIKLMQLSGPRSFSLATEQGENTGVFPPLRFISEFSTEGKPLDLSAQLQTSGRRTLWGISHQYEWGLDWRYSKNNGRGLIYDMNAPYAGSFTNTRPRAFSDIPASNILAAFLGDQMSYSIRQHQLTLYAGLRFSGQMGMDRSYRLSRTVFTEPRLNFQYGLPDIMLNKKPLKADVTIGYGQFYKQPTLLMLYPNKNYWDYTQLNYYHNDAQYRYVNFMTYVQNMENKNLTAAKSIKKELRLDLSYAHHSFFVTYFREDMTNGFRQMIHTVLHTYKQYDPTQVDLSQWNNGPDLQNTPYTEKQTNAEYYLTENGSSTLKSGVEFGYTSPRFKSINTRFTLTGAYFRTQYRNSVPVTERPSQSIGSDGFPYYGIYQNDDGYVNSNMNYNLFVDTYIPTMDLTISASLQGSLFDHRRKDQRIAQPIYYYGIDGVLHPFTEADKTDTYKQWLVRNISSDNLPTDYTLTMAANLKVTKSIYKTVRTSMFVTRIFNYNAPYYFNHFKIERKGTNRPYFGMELTYNF